jgi:hypothetical protein
MATDPKTCVCADDNQSFRSLQHKFAVQQPVSRTRTMSTTAPPWPTAPAATHLRRAKLGDDMDMFFRCFDADHADHADHADNAYHTNHAHHNLSGPVGGLDVCLGRLVTFATHVFWQEYAGATVPPRPVASALVGRHILMTVLDTDNDDVLDARGYDVAACMVVGWTIQQYGQAAGTVPVVPSNPVKTNKNNQSVNTTHLPPTADEPPTTRTPCHQPP